MQGNLTTERPAGTKNTIKIYTKNAAGVYEKPILLEECNEYAKAAAADGNQPLSEIQRVGLNNEVEYQYNTAKRLCSEQFSLMSWPSISNPGETSEPTHCGILNNGILLIDKYPPIWVSTLYSRI